MAGDEKTGVLPTASLPFNHLPIVCSTNFGAFQQHVFGGHVLMAAAATGLHGLDLVHYIHTFDHLAEHAIAPSPRRWRAVVEESVVLDVDEKRSEEHTSELQSHS